MKHNSRKRAPALRLVTEGDPKSRANRDCHLTVQLELKQRDRLNYIAEVQGMTLRRLVTRAVRRIIAEFDTAIAAGREVERDD